MVAVLVSHRNTANQVRGLKGSLSIMFIPHLIVVSLVHHG